MDLSIINELLYGVVHAGQALMWLIFWYYFVISIFGWVKRKEVPADYFPTKTKFAIVISAHNEEAVIGGAIKSLKEQNYSAEMFDIFVIADNCTDKTALMAEKSGARVYERFDNENKGKAYSLEWMFNQLLNMETNYDAICILDADNLVSRNFLLEMNKQLCLGNDVVQGYLDSKNPTDSWISGSYSISYWLSNRLFQLPRGYLGLSCALGGTGFIMRTEVLRKIGWGVTCLTEDLEFSVKLVLNNMKVSWAHEAKVYDEKPLKLAQSWKQRKRWMQGHCNCAARYFIPLMTKAIKEKKFICFDSALYLIQPMVIIANGIGLTVGACNLVMSGIISKGISTGRIAFWCVLLAMIYVNFVVLILEKKVSKKTIKHFLIYPLYSFTWIPIVLQGFFNRNATEWVHTIHTRAINIEELEGEGEMK